MSADNLPARMAEAIVSHEWTDFPRSAHNQHNYYAECAVCQRDVPRIAEVALAVLAEDPGSLPARMAEALWEALQRWDTSLSDAQPRERKQDYLARHAMSVRDGLVAHLAARAAKAEARVEHAEAGAQLSSEQLAKVRQELDRLWSPAPDSAGRHAAHCEWGATSGAYCSCVGLAEITRLRAERDALKAAIEDSSVARFAADALSLVNDYSDRERGVIARLPFLATFDQVCFEKYGLNVDRLAVLNAENTTTPARETA
jgi:hypothetical protein